MAKYDPKQFLEQLAPQILAELKPPKELKQFTNNTDIIGDYVEAGVRQLVRRYLAPIRVCTGGVIDEAQSPGDHIDQLDTIAWIPGPAPAVFEVGEFALVPRSSCLGVLEVKSSAYDVPKLAKSTHPDFVKKVTADLESQGHEGDLLGQSFGLGVVSILLEKQRGSSELAQLRSDGRVVVLFEEVDNDCKHNTKDICRLVNFLASLRLRAAVREGRLAINMGVL